MKECPVCRRCFLDHVNHCPDDGDATTPSIAGEPVLDSRYQLERRIGHGGMGVVFQARHIFLKTAHAIKVILPDLVGNDPMLVTRFRQEAIAAAAIHHQNIIAVTDFGVARGTMPFLVMEFIRGRSLQAVLAEEKVLSPERALEIMSPLCAGVSAAHRQNIVHRDLKPLNIMLKDGVPFSEGLKILDFGLAKIKSGELLGSFVQAQTSGLMGSPLYMAPEQWGEEEPDARADIYSLGVILFQMLGGDLPFKGPSLPSIMNKHLTMEPPALNSYGVNVPPVIEQVVRRALEKNPAKRPQTVDEFITQLREATAQVAAARHQRQSPQYGYGREDQTLAEFSSPAPSDSLNEATMLSPPEQGVSLEETRQNLDEQVDRLARELADAQARAEEARRRVEEATRRRAEEEAARRRAEEEEARRRAEEEEARRRAEEEARRLAEEEEAQRLAEEEAARQRDLEAAQKRAEEEAARRRAEEEANRLAQEVEEIKLRAEKARKDAEDEANRRAEEESARKLAEAKAEELKLKFEEAQRRAEEARTRAEEEARKNVEQEAARQRAEEEAARKRDEEAARLRAEEEAARLRAEEEANRLAREIADAQRSAEEARLRAEEEARRRAEEEAARRRAEEEASRLAREVEEAKRLAAEVRRLAEEAQRKAEEDTRRRLEEERTRAAEAARVSESEKTRALDPRDTQPPAEFIQTSSTQTDPAATRQASFGGGTASAAYAGAQTDPRAGGFPGQPPAASGLKSRALPVAAAAILVLGGGGYGLYRMLRQGETAQTTQANKQTEQVATRSDMILISGGTFKMGAENVAQTEDSLKQQPAHAVTVKPFFIGRTEVTNAEYAEFVRATGHAPPAGWGGSNPPAGREQWPVTNVSFDDAEAFAAWRSERDKVKYRLPTEEEWEFAARGGARGYRFPWGNDWAEDRANLGTGAGKEVDFPKPVGSLPSGATADGVLDMIGNVWEWTSSQASYYTGSDSQVAAADRDKLVIRGGSHQSLYSKDVDKRGGKEFPATFRLWVERDRTADTLGFRLARDGQGQ